MDVVNLQVLLPTSLIWRQVPQKDFRHRNPSLRPRLRLQFVYLGKVLLTRDDGTTGPAHAHFYCLVERGQLTTTGYLMDA